MKFAASALAILLAVPAIAGSAEPQFSNDVPVEEQRRYFTEDPVAPAIAPKGYDVTIVEYMDYQCPYCRATHEPLQKLLASDPKVRIIYRDWPGFGPASSQAALIAIASKYQGKHAAVHDALMETPLPLNDEKIKAVVKRAGADWNRIQKDIAAHSEEIEDLLARNDKQAQLLGLDATPGFIIGEVQSTGGMTLKQLRESVAKARETKGGAAARK
jgi:protein-disulfide isomerase